MFSKTIRRWRNTRHGILFLIFTATPLAAVNIEAGNEYDLVLDNGEEMKKVKVSSTDAVSVTVDMKGLAERLKIPLSAIKSARLIARKPLFSHFEAGVFGDFQFALADLRLLNFYFPQGGLAFTGILPERIRFIQVDAFTAEMTYASITDGERRIDAAGFTLSPRWHFKLLRQQWLFGIGGGISGLFLKSYNFTRFSQAGTFFAELGNVQSIGRIRLYGIIRANYWTDSQATLASVGFRIGAGYVW